MSRDEGPRAQERVESYGTGVGMGRFCKTGVTVRMDESKGSLCCIVYAWLGEEKSTGLHPYGEGLPTLEQPGVVSCGSRVSPARGEFRPMI